MTTATSTLASEELAAVRRGLLGILPIGVILIDADGHILEANPAAHELLYLRDQPDALRELAQRVGDPISGLPLVESELPWRRALHGQQVREREVSVVVPGRPSQRRILTLVARPFSRPTWPAPGAVIMAIDRVQLLARPPERRRLPPYLQNVLTRLCQGRSTEEISTDLNLTVATTRMYVKRLRLRLGARNQAELILRAVELGLHPSHWW